MKVLTVSKWLILVVLGIFLILSSMLFVGISDNIEEDVPQIEIILPEGENS